MSKVKIELNHEGIRELLRSSEMQAILAEHAERIATESGGEAESYMAQSRAVAEVRGDDGNNGLLKSMGGS